MSKYITIAILAGTISVATMTEALASGGKQNNPFYEPFTSEGQMPATLRVLLNPSKPIKKESESEVITNPLYVPNSEDINPLF